MNFAYAKYAEKLKWSIEAAANIILAFLPDKTSEKMITEW